MWHHICAVCRHQHCVAASVLQTPCAHPAIKTMLSGFAHFAASRPYPWGSELLAALKANSPPAVDISMQLLGPLRGGQGYSCKITVARQGPAAGAGAAQQQPGALGTWAAANSAAGLGHSLPSTVTPCKLLVGCTGTDELVLFRHVVLEKMESPTQVNVTQSWLRVCILEQLLCVALQF